MHAHCPLCWLQMMARLALWALEFLAFLRAAWARTTLAVRSWKP
jgi:hypothetical protein